MLPPPSDSITRALSGTPLAVTRENTEAFLGENTGNNQNSHYCAAVIPSHTRYGFWHTLAKLRILNVDPEPKHTSVISVKCEPSMKKAAMAIVARTGPGSISRYLRAILADLITKSNRGIKIAEPPQLLTEADRHTLERAKEKMN